MTAAQPHIHYSVLFNDFSVHSEGLEQMRAASRFASRFWSEYQVRNGFPNLAPGGGRPHSQSAVPLLRAQENAAPLFGAVGRGHSVVDDAQDLRHLVLDLPRPKNVKRGPKRGPDPVHLPQAYVLRAS